MRKWIFAAAGIVGMVAATSASAGTLEDVRARGHLNCIVNTGLTGFASPDDAGNWTGFDVEFCRAVAAAVLGDASKVEFVTATGKTRFTKLAAGEGEILSRNTTWTFSRDVDLAQTFIGVNYYDGQAFMAPAALGVKSAKELDGASVCIQTGTTTELNLAEFFSSNNMSYEPVPIETNAEARENYLAGRCDVYTCYFTSLFTIGGPCRSTKGTVCFWAREVAVQHNTFFITKYCTSTSTYLKYFKYKLQYFRRMAIHLNQSSALLSSGLVST